MTSKLNLCFCGENLLSSVVCPECEIVHYCSESCRKEDYINEHQKICDKYTTPAGKSFIKIISDQKFVNSLLFKAMELYYNVYKNMPEEYTQQVVSCEINLEKATVNFDIINQKGIDNPPNNAIEKHLKNCSQNFLLFVHDLNSSLVSTYEAEKITFD